MPDLLFAISIWETVAYAIVILLGVYLLLCFLPSYLAQPTAGPALGTPFISVVIPVYKETPKTLLETLSTWQAVDYPTWELIVADDTPGGPAIPYPASVKVLRRADRYGYKGGALRNACGHLSPTSEWLAVFDADARVPSDVLRRAATHFTAGVAVVQGYQKQSVALRNGRKNVLASWVYATHWLANRLLYGRWLLGGFVCSQGTTMFYRMSAVRSIGGLAPYATANEDLDTSFRLKMAGHRFVYDPELVGDGEAPPTLAAFARQQIRWTSSTVREYRRHLLPFLRSPRIRMWEKMDAPLFLLTWIACLVITPTLLFLPLLIPFTPAFWSFRWGWSGPSLALLLLPVVFPLLLFTAYGMSHRNLRIGAKAFGTYFALLLLGYVVSFYAVMVGITTDCVVYAVTPKGADCDAKGFCGSTSSFPP